MRALPHTRSCFVCGEANPIGLRLVFHTDGQTVHGHFTPRSEHAGFKGVIHGGLLATLMDEMMVWACAVATKRFAFCAELNVRFVAPARPGEVIHAEALLRQNRRDRVYETEAALRNESGQTLATATGKYMPMKEQLVAEQIADFVGDLGQFTSASEES